MTHRRTLLLIAACLACAPIITRAQTYPAPDLQGGKKLGDAIAPAAAALSASQLIEARYREYLKNFGLQLGASGNPSGAVINWGVEIVSVPSSDASWGKARNLAYYRAILNAQKEFVKFQSSRITVETFREIFSDLSQDSALRDIEKADEKSRLEVVKQKALALGEAELDAKLRQAGIDPAAFAGRPRYQKVDKLRDYFVKKVFTTAVQRLSGLRTLQTFEGWDEKQNYAVGVLTVYTPRMADLADVIASGRAGTQGQHEPARPILEQLPGKDADLVGDFGVRVLTDENGEECIVSFGQWSVAGGEGSERSKNIRLERALDVARTNADAAISEFANATLAWSRQQEIGERYDEYHRNYPEGNREIIEATDFIDKATEQFRVSGTLTIAGVADVKTWHATHPVSGHEIVGVVRAWSPSSQQRARDIHNRPAAQPSGGRLPAGPKSGTTQGNDYGKVRDW